MFILKSERKMKNIILVLLVSSVLVFANQKKAQDIENVIDLYNEQQEFAGTVLVGDANGIFYANRFYIEEPKNVIQYKPTQYPIGDVEDIFLNTIAIKLVQSNVINLTDSVGNYLTDCDNSILSDMRIQYLMTGESGIDSPREIFDEDELYKEFCEKRNYQPQSRTTFGGLNSIILRHLLVKASGKSYPALLNELIIEPADLENTGFMSPEKGFSELNMTSWKKQSGELKAQDLSILNSQDYIITTAEDLYKLYRKLMDDTYINPEYRQFMFMPINGTPQVGMGYGWYILNMKFDENSEPIQVYQRSHVFGGFSAMILAIPEVDSVIIVLSNMNTSSLRNIATGIGRVLLD